MKSRKIELDGLASALVAVWIYVTAGVAGLLIVVVLLRLVKRDEQSTRIR